MIKKDNKWFTINNSKQHFTIKQVSKAIKETNLILKDI